MLLTDVEWFEQAVDLLASQAATVEVQPPYWFEDQDNTFDPSTSYCHDCAYRLATTDALQEAICGGYVMEDDSPPFCAACGRRLDYTATDYCGKETLEVLAAYGWDWADADACFELDAAIGAFVGSGYYDPATIPHAAQMLAVLRAGQNLPEALVAEKDLQL